MSVSARPCAGPDDLDAMKGVLVEGRRASPHSGYIHVGDLDWWRFYLLRRYRWEEIAFLWETGAGSVVGWSLFSPGYGAFDLFVVPTERGSPRSDAMLAWTIERAAAQARAQSQETIATMWVFDDDRVWRQQLERCGFARDPDYALRYLVHSLDAMPPSRLPGGVRVRHVTGDDIESRAAAHRAAFGSQHMTTAAYRAFIQAPGYRPELDIIASTPDGSVAAFGMAWLDDANRVGEFEPVGTHPDWRGRGLGRAVLAEGLRRLGARGVRSAIVYVEADNEPAMRLYASVGFRQVNMVRSYTRRVE